MQFRRGGAQCCPAEGGSCDAGAPEWMREVAYKDEIPEFLGTLRKIGERDGFRLEDLRNRFANAFLGSVFWGGKEVVERVVESDDPAREKINRFKKWLKKLFS